MYANGIDSDLDVAMPRVPRWFLLPVACALLLAGCGGKHPYLPTVERVDLDRYLGTWYEIARYPAPFQEGCVATSATYSLRDDGKIRVLNRCLVERFDGELREAEGRAKIVDEATNAKLKVTFFWPFYGDYWVLGLGPDYEWALIGEPSRKYLWILSRTRQMDPSVYADIVARLPALGYDPERLLVTPQPAAE
jgi:apolipoprotein D and lipocalin family protein